MTTVPLNSGGIGLDIDWFAFLWQWDALKYANIYGWLEFYNTIIKLSN